MSQLFQFKSATVPSFQYEGADYLYVITNTHWVSIDIDTIDFGQLLDIVQKVNTGELYALRRTRLFDALDVKLGTDVSGNFTPTLEAKTDEWNTETQQYETTDSLRFRKLSVKDSKKQDILQYNNSSQEIVLNFENVGKGGGFVCITNVEPAEEGENTYKSETSSDGLVVDEIVVTNRHVIVTVLAITGSDSLKPAWVRVNGQDVALSMHTTENLWTGTIALADCGTLITAEHAEGSTDECVVVYHPRPTVSYVKFVGAYPADGQTHYHYNENVTIEVSSPTPIFGIYIIKESAGDALQDKNLLVSNNDFVSGSIVQVQGQTDHSIDGATYAGTWVTVMDQYGAWSDPVYSDASNNHTDHVNLIGIDSDIPQIAITGINYPASQAALKNAEQATIDYDISFTESLSITALNAELDIITPGPTVGGTITVERAGGTYNISSNNVRITAIKTSNNTSAYTDGCVYIANTAPVITFTGVHTSTRLRSGGNNGTSAQNYSIVLNTDQRLISAPSVSPAASAGTFTGSWIEAHVGDGSTYTRSLQVHDSITRGTYAFTLTSATNLAGITTTTITSGSGYTIGGFVSRTGTFDAGVAYDDIGVNVSGLNNATKLVVTISAVSGTYAANTTNINYSSGNHIFTVVSTGSPTVFNATGNALRINEANTVGANTTGLLPYTIEELA